ncbi:ranBP-type and C3HC4-type zinc finger-containing protein 1-like [Pelobates fuscus]|uniref:ranBP-type and C3HC4-type zinc finger-containing protein 1-like n=1 Tax=Pelobates fuscus TaxID=191477 RepID=UPI002FE4C973
MVSTGPVPGLEHTMPPLPTVLMSARAWREVPGSGREGLLLQLSMEAERAGDFRLSVRREPTKSPGNTVIAAFKLKDIFYDLKSSRCHELSTPGDAGAPMNFNFEDEREAQKWWTVVSSSLREARKASQGKDNDLRVKPALPEKPMTTANKPLTQAFKSLSLDDELPGEPKELATKEELALRLSRSIESGDEQMAVQCALMLTKQKIPLKIQLKQTTYPKKQILMKICVEDASGSVNISTSVQAHTTIATLKQQISREFLFHPNIQRWIIGQCLCSDDRTIASYGIRQDGDTAFLYLISAKQGRLHPQDHCVSNNAQPVSKPLVSLEEKQTQSKTLPTRTHANSASTNLRPGNDELLRDLPRILNSESSKTPGHVPAPLLSPAMADGWACSVCTYINKPTRPGCEMCSSDRPTDYVVPEKYKPDEIERKRLQQENDSLIQYKQALEEERQQNFMHLLQLDNEVLIPNQESIECKICFTDVPAGAGVLLRECLHSFCRLCLRQVVNCCEDPEVSCPFRDDLYACNSKLQQREIRALVSKEEYSRFLERGLVMAESRSQNSYHCKTADCKGWCIYEDSVNEFVCPICFAENCLTCKAIHDGMNCREYQDDLRIRALNDIAARQTNEMLKLLLQTGEAMYCPMCQIVVQKKDGCDWIRCTMCQTEICWVTKGPRWGPQGPGDTSGGCQCNVNGKRCDPKCQNCH